MARLAAVFLFPFFFFFWKRMKSLKIRKPRQEKTRGQTDEQPCGVRPAAGGLALSVPPHTFATYASSHLLLLSFPPQFPSRAQPREIGRQRETARFFPFFPLLPTRRSHQVPVASHTRGPRATAGGPCSKIYFLFFFFRLCPPPPLSFLLSSFSSFSFPAPTS